MEIVKYEPKYKADFIRLNSAWIEHYFDHLEESDYEVFENLDSYIKKGAMVFLAIEDDIVLATCMVFPLGEDIFEIGKLAADDKYKGRGAGSAVFHSAKEYALSHGAKKIILITNHILLPAIHIYEKEGFKKAKQDITDYARGDVQYEYIHSFA